MLVLLLGLAVILLDQLTKQYIRSAFVCGESLPVIDGLFNLVYVRNDGAAWNMLSGHGMVLILISVAVLILLIIYRRSFLQEQFSHTVLLGLMVGGIVGNLIDRIRFGWVTDFLDFHIGTHHWPSFNIADSAICIAAGLYIITNLIQKKEVGQGAESGEQGDG
ncbi:MAG: signal peptidase II [Verrucomicrobia bacterium]|nr:signal peptidase II [Verrucomicrobiota bacterium]